MNNPNNKSPERAFALQKYLLLHSQHDALQKHLTHIATSVPNTTTPSPSHSPTRPTHSSSSSLSSSPDSDSSSTDNFLPPPKTLHYRSGSIPASSLTRPQRPLMSTRRSSLPTVIYESVLEEIEEEEGKLKDVNQQIKSTLTDLLNCKSVRQDRRYRMWVQSRLMDAERELKRQRSESCSRRRSVGGVAGF